MLHALGKLAYFALVGFVGVLLIGPVVGVVGALLPFAMVGLLGYGIHHGVAKLLRMRRARRKLAVVPVEVKAPEPVVLPVRDETPKPCRLRRAGRVLQEMVCGAAVAGAVAAAFCWQSPAMGETIAVAVAAGALVGFVVGGSLPETRKTLRAECSGEAC